MALIMNELHEFVDDFDPKPPLKLKPCGKNVFKERKREKAEKKTIVGRFDRADRRCDVCGSLFKPKNRYQKRCSFTCSQEGKRRAARVKKDVAK